MVTKINKTKTEGKSQCLYGKPNSWRGKRKKEDNKDKSKQQNRNTKQNIRRKAHNKLIITYLNVIYLSHSHDNVHVDYSHDLVYVR